jgi:hypothetical protein
METVCYFTLIRHYAVGNEVSNSMYTKVQRYDEMYELSDGPDTVKYRNAPRNDVSVNEGPHIRRWSHKIIIL